MKAKNLKEFKALIERYETITIEEITKGFRRYTSNEVPEYLTGFGASITCSLCVSAGSCNNCVYHSSRNCVSGVNKKTYNRIENANTSLKLLNAYRARAKHMRT